MENSRSSTGWVPFALSVVLGGLVLWSLASRTAAATEGAWLVVTDKAAQVELRGEPVVEISGHGSLLFSADRRSLVFPQGASVEINGERAAAGREATGDDQVRIEAVAGDWLLRRVADPAAGLEGVGTRIHDPSPSSTSRIDSDEPVRVVLQLEADGGSLLFYPED